MNWKKTEPRKLSSELGISFTPQALVIFALSKFLEGNMELSYKTADYTLILRDSGKVFTTKGATASVRFTLPSADFRWMVLFVNGADIDMYVFSNQPDTLITNNDMSADGIGSATAAEKIGSAIFAFCDGRPFAVTSMVPRYNPGIICVGKSTPNHKATTAP